MKKIYISYEEDIRGEYTESEFHHLYITLVDKAEYKTFEDWKFDMLRSGVFELL